MYYNEVPFSMTTIELIDKLIEITTKRSEVLSGFDWQDAQLMIELEIDNRKSLYPESQYSNLIDSIRDQFNILRSESAKSVCNKDNVSSCLILLKGLITSLPDLDFATSFLQNAAFEHEKLIHFTDNTAIVLGDSHVNFFSGNNKLTFKAIGDGINVCPNITNYKFTCLHLGPCLAYNCMNENSKYAFYKKVNFLCNNFIKPGAKICVCLGEIDIRAHVFKEKDLQKRPWEDICDNIICDNFIRPGAKICVCLGEIDIRAHVFKEKDLQKRSWEDICDNIIANYMDFLIELKSRGFRVYCWGPIASMPDNTSEEEELKALAAEGLFDQELISIGSESERNTATAYFTQKLSDECANSGITFMSIFDQMVDTNMKTDVTFLADDKCHLNSEIIKVAEKIWITHEFI